MKWGIEPSLEDKIWLMEQGIMPKNKDLMNKYYSAKAYAKQQFLNSMKGVSGFNNDYKD